MPTSSTAQAPSISWATTQGTFHRGNPRAWLQFNHTHPAAQAGFIANARYDIEYLPHVVILTLNPEGKRKVSNTSRGATLDINCRATKQYVWTRGITWEIQQGRIIIHANSTDATAPW